MYRLPNKTKTRVHVTLITTLSPKCNQGLHFPLPLAHFKHKQRSSLSSPMHKCPFLAAAPVPAAPSMGMASSSGHSSSNYSFRNNMFDRNPTTWVPQAPMRNGK